MRLFLALLPGPAALEHLTALQKALSARGVSGRAVRPENLHMTLAFLGEQDDPERVVRALGTLRFAPVCPELRRLGVFGKTLWVGGDVPPALQALSDAVRDRLERGGVSFERTPFVPHVTLLRGASAVPEGVSVPPFRMRAARVRLMRSELTPGGARYTPLVSFPLEGA